MTRSKKIELLSIERCFRYVELLEISNDQLQKMFGECQKLFQQKQITKKFFEKKEKDLGAKYNYNNEIILELEAKIFKSLRNDLGKSATLPDDFARLAETIKQEKERVTKKSVVDKPKLVVK